MRSRSGCWSESSRSPDKHASRMREMTTAASAGGDCPPGVIYLEWCRQKIHVSLRYRSAAFSPRTCGTEDERDERRAKIEEYPTFHLCQQTNLWRYPRPREH